MPVIEQQFDVYQFPDRKIEAPAVEARTLKMTDLRDYPTRRYASGNAAPSANAPDGTMVLFDDGTNRRLYIMVNKTWRYTALT